MSPVIAVTADLLVAILLAFTIVTSLHLSRRIRALKGDEAALRGTIAELVGAADTAERAITSLRLTVAESERSLADRLREAEASAVSFDARIAAGRSMIERIGTIASLSRRAVGGTDPAASSDAASSGAASPDGAPADARPAAPATRADRIRSAGSAVEAALARLARRGDEQAA